MTRWSGWICIIYVTMSESKASRTDDSFSIRSWRPDGARSISSLPPPEWERLHIRQVTSRCQRRPRPASPTALGGVSSGSKQRPTWLNPSPPTPITSPQKQRVQGGAVDHTRRTGIKTSLRILDRKIYSGMGRQVTKTSCSNTARRHHKYQSTYHISKKTDIPVTYNNINPLSPLINLSI